MITERLQLPIEDLLLDKENPRIGEVNTQAQALAAIIELDVRYFRTMMNSIRDHGLDPGDSFYVIADEGDPESYTVVDGNRRLAAIKVLSGPTILQSAGLPDSITKPLEKATEAFVLGSIDPVNCVLFETRSDANEWILRRHGRGLEGEGRLAWGPLEIQRFQKDRTILDIIEFVEQNSTFAEDQWRLIKHAVENASSSLRRFVESKKGREWLNLTILEQDGKKIPHFQQDPSFVLNVLSKIFSDISHGTINTRSHNRASEIREYFDNLPTDLHPDKSRTADLTSFAEAEIKDSETRPRQVQQPAQTKAAPAATTKAKPLRLTLAPSRHTFAQPKSEKSVQILREASIIRLKDQPLASAFVLRAFLQQTIDTYMTDNNMPFWERNKQLDLSVRAERVIDHLIQSSSVPAKDLAGVRRTLATSADPASIKALNDYHHDRFQVPAIDVLRGAWDSAIPLFQAVYGPA